jgi:DNA-binding transcriptional LysR family regulator
MIYSFLKDNPVCWKDSSHSQSEIMLDRLTGLEVFAKVAAIGSLSGAARSLGMSQTMVTKHVAALETRLGTKLFHRTTRRLSITEAGRSYLESTERILVDMEAADAAIAAERVEPRGLLRVNVPVVFGTRQIAPLLAEFANNHPKVTTELGLNDRVVDLAEEGWDMAIRIGKLRDSSMVARRLAPNRLIVCAAPSYLAKHGTPRTVADLASHNCLGYTLSQQAQATEWLFGRDGEIRVQVSGNLRANNGEALRAASLEGLGLARQPTFIVADDLRAGRLVRLPLDQPEIQTSAVHAIYLPERRPPAKVRAFIDFLAARFSPDPPWDRGLF